METKDIESRDERPNSFDRGSERNSRELDLGISKSTAKRGNPDQNECFLMEAMLGKDNMQAAYKRVIKNKGSAGVEKMTTEELGSYLMENWLQIKSKLLDGSYKPNPVKLVEIPKANGCGVRKLGIPTVVDRLIQQAIHQILSPIFEKGFSNFSFGFRPNRSAHQAIELAREYVSRKRRWVVDIDLEKFFDRVNHDILMSRIARKIKDKRILLLIRRYLQSGVMADGLVSIREQGTPQGGPLSPLLSNVLLDELDKELERRGHAFCRYADDCNIYVKSQKAGERVMESIKLFLERKLKLKINTGKSAVARPWKRKFLGYSITTNQKPKLKPAKESVDKLKGKLKDKFRKSRSCNLEKFIQELKPILKGWINYFSLSEVKKIFEYLDSWIRRKLRCIIWRQKKKWKARRKMLMKRGIDEERAQKSVVNGHGSWWNAGSSHMNQAFPKIYFDAIGLISLLDEKYKIKYLRTAVYGTVRTVV
jgi:RNA-directed DNA polymerase